MFSHFKPVVICVVGFTQICYYFSSPEDAVGQYKTEETVVETEEDTADKSQHGINDFGHIATT